MSSRDLLRVAVLMAVVASPLPVFAQAPVAGEPYTISRATGSIVIDGNLSDEGWRDAVRIERWYEINPGDNVEPRVHSVGYLTYDDKFFYAGFEFDDPNPSSIVAPFGDHDYISSYIDFGGLFLDTRHEGHTAYEFFVSAHNIQFDAVQDDSTGENGSPDFFWQSATRITPHGWTLEIAIPFSSLRYKNIDPQTWGVILYRNYPRGFRYQLMSVKVPRGGQCFVCRESPLHGLDNLPPGGHIVAAPYMSASDVARPRGPLGSPLAPGSVDAKAGLDVKWTANADNALDGTIKPDFSQVEADTAQIATNQRFALFYPEKRPFFLEGVELLSTPIQAVYTRTITAPRWGGRATGKLAGITYTALVADDSGGGSVVLPGANSSSLAPQDFSSTVFMGRMKRDFGLSFVSMLMTDRENGVNGHNRVVGPDFQWRAHGTDTVVGQWLVSDTTLPNRPGTAPAWTGQALSSGAGQVQWNHNTEHYDAAATYKDYGGGFRADTGFVPQVGYRETYGETGWTFRPHGFISRARTFLIMDRQIERDGGALITHQVSPGIGMDTRFSGFMRFRYENDRVRAGDETFPRQQFVYTAFVSPSRRFAQLGIDGFVGQDVDFENVRPGRGAVVNLNATVNATDHLVVDLLANQQWLHVNDASGISRPLFTARVSRVRTNYTFTARSFVRVIAQYVSTDHDPALYLTPTSAKDGTFSGSVLFAYKVNWQSVLFIGYGDDRELSDRRILERSDRQVFVKMSYAFQR